ncbi:hypothetical protein MROS_1118 [Melioribacter roseus P3M-2]|uniref:DUF4007 domain-containing protein n=2 Tax=Melioribacter roseus TaxID=1134405 RepID=I6YUW5_MELRP|nr:hypothetical protein MROS_1118 [Melioribacter roseus P3M-2]
MVTAINYWMKSIGLINKENTLTELAHFIFGKNGVDPYLENTATLWLLHYHLVKEYHASIYSLVFNEIRKKRIEFNKIHLQNFLKAKCEETNTRITETTIKRDIAVFLRNYVKPSNVNKNLEDYFSSIFIELNLVERLLKFDEKETEWYRIENKEREDLPAEVLLFCILDNEKYSDSILLEDVLHGYNSVGNIFAITAKDIINKIEELIIKRRYKIDFKDDAGIRIIQFTQKLNKWRVLKDYYEK